MNDKKRFQSRPYRKKFYHESDSSISRGTSAFDNRFGEKRMRYNDEEAQQIVKEEDLDDYFEQGRFLGKEKEYLALNLLAQDPILKDEDLDVEVEGRVLYLRGHLDSRWKKKRAEMLIEAVPEIIDIQNFIRLERMQDFSRSGWISELENIEDQI